MRMACEDDGEEEWEERARGERGAHFGLGKERLGEGAWGARAAFGGARTSDECDAGLLALYVRISQAREEGRDLCEILSDVPSVAHE